MAKLSPELPPTSARQAVFWTVVTPLGKVKHNFNMQLQKDFHNENPVTLERFVSRIGPLWVLSVNEGF